METLTVTVPLRIRRRGGRKLVLVPDGWTPEPSPPVAVDGTLLRALARAHRWRRMMERGEHATLDALAAAEKVNPSLLCRILRLTLLAPDIVTAILDGTQPRGLRLEALLARFPMDWQAQRERFGFVEG